MSNVHFYKSNSYKCWNIFTFNFHTFFFFQNRTHNKVVISVYLLAFFFIISTLTYYPRSFLEFEFYRRDGNFFIAYVPLLVIPLFKVNIKIDQYLIFFVIWSSLLNLIFLIIYFITGGTIFIYEQNIYHFLFLAHNAAGGFLSIITAFNIGCLFNKRTKKFFLLLLLINLIGLVVSYSRGSILGILIGYLITKINKTHFKKMCFVLILSQIIMMAWFYNNAASSFLEENEFSVEDIDLSYIHNSGNIIIRGFYMWPRAIYLFLTSPLVGTGFGSFNDRPYELDGIDHIFKINKSKNIYFSDDHAHHTFLHVLADTGLLGLTLLIFFLYQTWKFIISIPSIPLKTGLHIAFWVNIISSLTEHRLFTPSQVLSFNIILALAITNYRPTYPPLKTDC